MRPSPHERDGRQPFPGGGLPHPPQHQMQDDPMMREALRRVVAQQIGPRGVGAIYRNADGAFEVLRLVLDPELARALLRRRCVQWALVIRDVLRPDGESFVIGSVWTTSDHLVREADALGATGGEAEA
ncbi:hypothetical protein [Streptomyces sp. NPDC093094]|uniref:hypothetical protein n=1 Tax=Streptomyces sp. NPDC093094 TaxID=3366026 RepID=UPI00381D0571